MSKHRKNATSYADMTFDHVCQAFSLAVGRDSFLAPITPARIDNRLASSLEQAATLSLRSEKARSEFIVAPFLLALSVLRPEINILSGEPFDVDKQRGLRGICDFILCRGPRAPRITAPVLLLVEAKKQDLEMALGQCVAEMVAAQIFNSERNDRPGSPVFGCSTSGDVWEFYRLHGNTLTIEQPRLFLSQPELILGALHATSAN